MPDLAGWRRETMPEYPDAAYCTVAQDRVGKRDLQAREGVGHFWFFDPDARTLEAFELSWLPLATLDDDASVSLPPFDAITLPVDALWPDATAGNGEKS